MGCGREWRDIYTLTHAVALDDSGSEIEPKPQRPNEKARSRCGRAAAKIYLPLLLAAGLLQFKTWLGLQPGWLSVVVAPLLIVG